MPRQCLKRINLSDVSKRDFYIFYLSFLKLNCIFIYIYFMNIISSLTLVLHVSLDYKVLYF